MNLSRDQVFHIWSAFSLERIREVFRMRNRVKQLKSDTTSAE